MKFLSKIRILFLLVAVAMLAFTVRLVDFAAGVSSMSGSAYAEDEAMPDTGLLDDPMGDPIGDPMKETAMAETSHEEEAPPMEGEAKGEVDIVDEPEFENSYEPDEWRDPVYDGSGFSQATRDVLEDMSERRKELDQRERELSTREALLRAAEQEIERKFEEMTNLRTEIEGLLVQQSEEEEARIKSLVKIYEGMKPKEAARIFDTLDLDVLTAVLSRMSERRLSPILANMDPERARTVTILLAQEKQLPDFPQSN